MAKTILEKKKEQIWRLAPLAFKANYKTTISRQCGDGKR